MTFVEKQVVAMFVDKACPEHWVVRDPEGIFWIVRSVENAWDSREPFYPTEETELEPVPAHYRYLLDLPNAN